MSRLWNWRAKLYDFCEGSQLRRAPAKSALFQGMTGRTLFVAVGTGLDIACFPPGRSVVAIDLSAEMLRRAEARRRRYPGELRFVRADAMNLCFQDGVFDTVVTSCTLCSVPQPDRTLRELRRVLRPGGRLLMFEHVRSRHALFGLALDIMTLWTRLGGTEMNRATVDYAVAAGFSLTRVESAFLDIIVSVQAVKPLPQETRKWAKNSAEHRARRRASVMTVGASCSSSQAAR